MHTWTKDYISPNSAGTLFGLMLERVKASPDKLAYKHYNPNSDSWVEYSWHEADQKIDQWQHAIHSEGFAPGDRVAVMLRNCPEWVFFEQAALRCGLVIVPLYPNDRPDNISHIVNESNVRLILIEGQPTLDTIFDAAQAFKQAVTIVSLDELPHNKHSDSLTIQHASGWLPQDSNIPKIPPVENVKPDDLATIVYTSGTTGFPKGVMLSHKNILTNAYNGLQSVVVFKEDLFLSFLPLSHTLERTVGYYIPVMTGAAVAFSRSIPELAQDLLIIRPTILISVPRIFERVRGRVLDQINQKSAFAQKLFNLAQDIGWKRFEYMQKRASWSASLLLWPVLNKLVASKVIAKLGGRIRFTICGGAPLSPPVAKLFIGLGLPVLQGYGLTEASPIISVNPMENNIPDSIGPALPGVDVKIAADGELLTRSDCVMLGYWQNEQATSETFTTDGWLKTGDLAALKGDHLFITGRKKEILVLSSGEKVPPADVEMAITLDPLFEQALVIGEGCPTLAAIIVLNPEEWNNCQQSNQLPDTLDDAGVIRFALDRINKCMHQFPGYARIHHITLTLEPWSDENGMLTASLKMRRKPICDKYSEQIEMMYAGHQAKNQ